MIEELVMALKVAVQEQVDGVEFNASDVIKRFEFAHGSACTNPKLMNDSGTFFEAISLLLKGKIRQKVAIFPCSSFIEIIIRALEGHDITLCDTFKAGKNIQGYTIKSTDIINQEPFDLVLIISYREQVRDALMEKAENTDNIFWLYDVVKKHVEKDSDVFDVLKQKNEDFSKVDQILAEIEAQSNPVVFLNGILFNNFEPTFNALKEGGFEPCIISRNNYLAYAKPDSTIEDFGVKKTFQLDLMEIVYLCLNLKKAKVIINDISFFLPCFDAKKAIINFAFVAALLKLIRVPTFLILYDVIHSVMKNHQDTEEYFTVYKRALSLADGIICNSNTREVQSSIRYGLGIQKPMLSFYRYNQFVPHLKPRINDGEFHLVIIGGMDDKLRDSRMMLKKILNQKVHVHNYVCNAAIDEFIHELNEGEMAYFHRHESIVSQSELIYEISQYHAGWIMDNGFEVLNMINSATNKDFKEMLMMFRLTTISSSLLAVASAGLPMFLNKMVVHVTYQFPQEFFIPLEEPEVANFLQLISDIDWDRRYEVTEAKRELFSIDRNINELITWMSGFDVK